MVESLRLIDTVEGPHHHRCVDTHTHTHTHTHTGMPNPHSLLLKEHASCDLMPIVTLMCLDVAAFCTWAKQKLDALCACVCMCPQASAVSSRRTTRTGSEPSNSSSRIHYLRGGGELIAPAVDSIPEHHPIAAPLPPHVATRPHRYGPPPVSTVPRVLANGRKIHGVGHAGFLDTAYA